MSPPDEGTAGSDGPTQPIDEPSSTSEGEGDRPDHDSSSEFLTERLITDLRLNPSKRSEALGRLGHYEILSVVGAGAMGVVLKAFDDELYRTVAIKVLSSHLMASEQARLRFKREARAAAPLNHPNVVTIHEIEEHREVPYLVMEYVDGLSLQQRIARSAPMLVIDILRLSQQIAIGLSAAHRNGVVHRDIKPANIMLEDGIERVKITDFGLAKAAMGNSDLTSFGKMIGTPSYMSPEQVSGDPLDGRSDLYSLGCVMYSMVAGGPPFRGENCLAVAHRIRTEAPAPLRDKYPDVPRFLEAIILRLLEKEPGKRFQSADELAAVLTQRLAKVNLGGSSYAFSDAGTTKVLKPPEGTTGPKSKRLKLSALVVCMAGLLASLWMLVPEAPPGPPPPAPPIEERPTITVHREEGKADANTITKALRLVRERWTVIKVLDDSVYQEKLSIAGPRFHGLILMAEEGATLRHNPDQVPPKFPDTEALIDIDSVSDVTIKGFRLKPGAFQWGIRIRGNCPGMDISMIHSTHPPNSERVFLFGHQGASGTVEKPIRLHDLVVQCGSGAFYFTSNFDDGSRPGGGNPIENIDIEDNAIFGSDQSELLTLTEVENRSLPSHVRINFRRNLLVGGKAGVVLYPQHPDAFESVVLARNTFVNLGTLIATLGGQVSNSDLLFDSNLVINTAEVIAPNSAAAKKDWFRNMHWELSQNCNRSAIERVATAHPLVLMQSRKIDDPGFMRPQPDALPDVEGPFPGAYERGAATPPEESSEDNSIP